MTMIMIIIITITIIIIIIIIIIMIIIIIIIITPGYNQPFVATNQTLLCQVNVYLSAIESHFREGNVAL